MLTSSGTCDAAVRSRGRVRSLPGEPLSCCAWPFLSRKPVSRPRRPVSIGVGSAVPIEAMGRGRRTISRGVCLSTPSMPRRTTVGVCFVSPGGRSTLRSPITIVFWSSCPRTLEPTTTVVWPARRPVMWRGRLRTIPGLSISSPITRRPTATAEWPGFRREIFDLRWPTPPGRSTSVPIWRTPTTTGESPSSPSARPRPPSPIFRWRSS